ncbi:MAG: tetrahydrofolate dehydrogenase/cyclohydrolase catalytic domain-containing protein, partial [Bacteroidota bacterium]
MKILDGKSLSELIKKEIQTEVAAMVAGGKKAPHLAAILVGTDGASETYVGSKVKTCG